jgi:hypothetical protein
MPQIFSPAANSLARLSLILGALVPVLVLAVGVGISRSPFNTGVGIPVDQPVPFSHQHHAWELGIDCRYCHVTVETAAIASFPTTETCMTCHGQIWVNSPLLEPVRQSYETGTPIRWQRVGDMPDFAHFDHSIHIDRGISCNNCHGAVQQMDVTYRARAFHMRWCLECHREPELYLFKDPTRPDLTPREQVFNLYLKYQKDPEGRDMLPVERRLIQGGEQRGGAAHAAAGKKLLDEYGVNREQLADCGVCHF